MISEQRLEQLADDNIICKVSWDERVSMAAELLALRKTFSEPAAFQNNYTGKLWRPEQQPGAEQDKDVYTPLYRKPKQA